jgi:hypothetical protein
VDENEEFYTCQPMEGGGFVHIFRLAGHQGIFMHRRNYRPYSETPTTKGPSVLKNPKTAKLVVRGIASLAGSWLIGQAYKLSKQIDEKIDTHYKETYPEYFPDKDEKND